jgi:hypothetical protein
VSASAQLVIQIPEGMRQGEQAQEQRVDPGCTVSTGELDGPDGASRMRRETCSNEGAADVVGRRPIQPHSGHD